jgi:hypothetical protein
MAVSPLLRVAQVKGCDMPHDARLTPQQEAREVLRCLWESLRKPAFASTVVHLIFGISDDWETAVRSQSEPSDQMARAT